MPEPTVIATDAAEKNTTHLAMGLNPVFEGSEHIGQVCQVLGKRQVLNVVQCGAPQTLQLSLALHNSREHRPPGNAVK